MRYLKNELLVLVVLILTALVSIFGIIFEINKKFSIEIPAFGGTLKEGVIGNPKFINPIFAQTDADKSTASLIYAGLMRYDGNGKLKPNLLESYEISEDGLEYTVKLKENLKWSNGKKLTVDDIIFTIQLAKNPLTQSPKRANWEGVEINKFDEKTIHFKLRKPYATFLDNLTLGIIPQYFWEKVPPSQISLSNLNTSPVGAGPYKVDSIEKNSLGSIVSISLSANKYFVLGKPNIKNIILKFISNEGDAIRNLKNGSIDSFGGLSSKYIKELSNKNTLYGIGLQRIIGIFLNDGNIKSLGTLSVRQALNQAIDKETLVQEILGRYGIPINGPLPPNIQKQKNNMSFNKESAKTMIEKKAKGLALTITTADTPELTEIANFVKKMWEDIGIKVEIKPFALTDLEQLVVGPRRYDAFLYGEEITGEIPDLFAFWHSSQRTHPGYNIALYANSKVDKLLEDIRITLDSEKRKETYEKIYEEISKDLPAIFLFSPSYVYVTPKNLYGININTIGTSSERFSTINEWYLKKQFVWKMFAK